MGIQEPDHQRNHAGIIDECSSRRPLSDGSSMPVTAGTRLVLGKITSRVIRNCFQRRGWRTFTVGGVNQKAGSVRTSSPIAFRQQWGNLSHQLPTGFRLRPGVEVLQGIEADYDAPQILPCGGPGSHSPQDGREILPQWA